MCHLCYQAYIKIYQGEDLPQPKTMLMVHGGTIWKSWTVFVRVFNVFLSHKATAEANNLAAVAAAKDHYYKNMEKVGLFALLENPFCIFMTFSVFSCKVCGGDLPFVAPESLEEKHHFNFKEALHTFSSTKKMGGQDFCARYQAQLEKELEEMWQSFRKHNQVEMFPMNVVSVTLDFFLLS